MSERTDYLILGRKVAEALEIADVKVDVYGVLTITSELLARGVLPMVPTNTIPINILVNIAQSDIDIIAAVQEDRRIDAIKILRTRTLVGLKEAKDAIDIVLPRTS